MIRLKTGGSYMSHDFSTTRSIHLVSVGDDPNKCVVFDFIVNQKANGKFKITDNSFVCRINEGINHIALEVEKLGKDEKFAGSKAIQFGLSAFKNNSMLSTEDIVQRIGKFLTEAKIRILVSKASSRYETEGKSLVWGSW
ncbi:hypothetical protein ACRJUP_003821, partial [Acinetobacter baumannii]